MATLPNALVSNKTKQFPPPQQFYLLTKQFLPPQQFYLLTQGNYYLESFSLLERIWGLLWFLVGIKRKCTRITTHFNCTVLNTMQTQYPRRVSPYCIQGQINLRDQTVGDRT